MSQPEEHWEHTLVHLQWPSVFKISPSDHHWWLSQWYSLHTVSANTNAQLLIAAQGPEAFSRIRNLLLACPCDDQTFLETQMSHQSACQAVSSVCVGVIETCLVLPVSLICLSVEWPIITAMSRRQRQPIISGPAGQAQPIRSGIPMVTCAWKPGHNQ